MPGAAEKPRVKSGEEDFDNDEEPRLVAEVALSHAELRIVRRAARGSEEPVGGAGRGRAGREYM